MDAIQYVKKLNRFFLLFFFAYISLCCFMQNGRLTVAR